ncbi:MAG: MCE family protein [Deltaproteobacteria bacterium]|nr:MCE family protein [Deltaproteobacteria bacterium]
MALKLSPEAKVGIFVFIGIILLVYMSLRVGGIQFGREAGYDIYIRFDSAAGLDKDASVRVAGVEIGRVKDILLQNNKARVVLRIHPDVKIGKDFTAVLKTKGLLGERYIELIPGSPSAASIEPGGEITRITTYTDMDKLITILSDAAVDIKKVSEALGNVLGGSEGQASLKNIVNNIEDITKRLDNIVKTNDEKFGRMMTNFEVFSEDLKGKGPEIIKGLKEVADNLNQVIAENRDTLKDGFGNLKAATQKLGETMDTINKLAKNIEPKINDSVNSIDSIVRKIDKGEGTLGKLVNDPAVHDNINKTLTGINSYLGRVESFKTFIGYRGEYLFDANNTKSYLSLKLQPKADKYYLLEVIDDPRGLRATETRETTVGTTTTTTKEVKTSDSLKFSLQIAKRFKDLTLRGGIIESKGGVGMDYHMFNDRLKFTFEAFDFDNNKNPHLKAGLIFNLNKYFFVVGGYDDFVSNTGLESPYLGIGFHFEDEDIKYLLSSTGSAVTSAAK